MNLNKSIVFTGLLLAVTNAYPGGIALSENDCLDILERWAADPASVPAHLVNHCRDMLTAGGARDPAGYPVNASGIPLIEPAAGRPDTDDETSSDPQASMNDPCADPSGANSLYCWGPWTDLLPAAGPVIAATLPPELLDPRPEDLGRGEGGGAGGGEPPGNLPLGSCQAGQSCGFATLVNGITARANSEDTTLVPFDLAQDGSQFIVDPDGPNEIVSNDNMQPRYRTNPFGQEIMVSERTDGDIESKLQARVFRDSNGEILQSGDIWKHGKIDLVSPDSGRLSSGNSGEYAWGIASSQETLDSLNNGQGVSVSFSGLMAVDQSTQAAMTVNFGSQPTWTGQWNNPAYNFSAGGFVTGVDLISDPNQFSSNVQNNSYVQGALLGEQNDQSVAHAIDVNLDVVGNVKDVGLLRSTQ